MMFKPSQFNFVYEKDGIFYAYNTFSKALISLKRENLKYFENSEIDGNDEIAITLQKNGFLVEQSFDELAFLKYYNLKARYATDYLCVTIAPTLSCNFDCPYCFEKKRTGIMSDDIQKKLIEFIQSKINMGVNVMEITWYGGEPLLCKDLIIKMTEQIFDIANTKNVKCKMGMISNGYLLEREFVDFLEKYHIAIQITLDGMQEKHNSRRYLKNGDGTFGQIVKNLSLFTDKNIDVYVRMNVDRDNKDNYEQLDKLVSEFHNEHMILYPAMTEKINERKEERKDIYLNDSGYDDFIALTRKNDVFKFDSTKIPISNDVGKIPDNKCYFCTAELDNSYVVDNLGNVYKCWDEVGSNEVCFNLINANKINYENLFRYIGDHIFEDEKCSKCRFIPICFGGCKFHRYHFNKYACAYTEKSIIEYIEDCLL